MENTDTSKAAGCLGDLNTGQRAPPQPHFYSLPTNWQQGQSKNPTAEPMDKPPGNFKLLQAYWPTETMM